MPHLSLQRDPSSDSIRESGSHRLLLGPDPAGQANGRLQRRCLMQACMHGLWVILSLHITRLMPTGSCQPNCN